MRPKQMCLIDTIGAFVSAFMHGVVLPIFHDLIGMPKIAFYVLAVFPLIYFIYDLRTYLHKNPNWSSYFRNIIFFNLGFCVFSILAMFYFRHDLTNIGWIYLVLEILVVLFIVGLENKTLKTLRKGGIEV